MRSRLRAACDRATSREPGQIIVMFAVFLVVLTVLAGSAYDYASIVVEDAKLHNAVDAAALAGSYALVKNAGTPGTGPQNAAGTVTADYLARNGFATQTPGTVINISFPASTPVPGLPTPSTPLPVDNLSITATKQHTTSFWPLVGIPTVTLQHDGDAHAGRGMLDIMLVFDTTGSMLDGISNPSDANPNSLWKARKAAAAFIRAMNPTDGDVRGARIAMARFQGWKTPCLEYWWWFCTRYTDDYTLLTPGLIDDQAELLRLADDIGTATCLNATYACPLKSVSPPSGSPGGTRIPNGLHVVGTAASSVFTGPGSRNNVSTGVAKKVLILLTDGENDVGNDSIEATWDTEAINLANALRPGATASPDDDVEIYTINFQCRDTDLFGVGGCDSRLAANGGSGSYQCPSATRPNAADISNSDRVLIEVSSSSVMPDGQKSCDHYFPIRKSDNLPQLFMQLAGAISRGQLTK